MRRQRRRRSDDALDDLINKGQAGKVHMQKQRPKIQKHIAQIRDLNGVLKSDQAGILDVFAGFYEQLYLSPEIATTEPCASEGDFFEVDVSEVKLHMRRFLRKMKTGKSCAEDGLVAEMLQSGCDHLLHMLASLFSDLLSGRGGIPEEWKVSRLIVLYKKGDASMPKNYRPIISCPL